jgi:hypothetical protein
MGAASIRFPLRCNKRRDLESDRQPGKMLMADAEDLSAIAEHAPQVHTAAIQFGDGSFLPRAATAGHNVNRSETVLGKSVYTAAADDFILKAFYPILTKTRGSGWMGTNSADWSLASDVLVAGARVAVGTTAGCTQDGRCSCWRDSRSKRGRIRIRAGD